MDKNEQFLDRVEEALTHEFHDKEVVVKKLYDGLTQLKILKEMKHLHSILNFDSVDEIGTELENLEFVDYKYSKSILKQRCKLLQSIVKMKVRVIFNYVHKLTKRTSRKLRFRL